MTPLSDDTDRQAHLDHIVASCDRFRHAVDEIYTDYRSGHVSDRSALLGLTVVAQLRRLNRIAYFGSKDAKADVASLKTGQEKQHLELQNYLYEQTNLREEIRKCLQREYSYVDIDMHTQDEFLALAPACLQSADPHEQMLNRLSFELQERERLLEEKRALHRQRQALLDENKKRGQELREVDEKFDDLYKLLPPLVDSLHRLEQSVADTATLTASSIASAVEPDAMASSEISDDIQLADSQSGILDESPMADA